MTKTIKLRDYQQEVINLIDNLDPGRYLVVLPTGTGKTVTFANAKRQGKMLILSHREELVVQPKKYFDCSTSIEMANQKADLTSEIVSASVQSLNNRLDKYDPNHFDIIIVDEAHHSVSPTYLNILNYFKPRLVIGFTATPNRADGIGLSKVYSRIIFERDLKWAIENGWLSPIYCKRVTVNYDLRSVRSNGGDFVQRELNLAMEGTGKAIADVYKAEAVGATIIFASGVKHAEEISKHIPGSMVVTGETANRAEIIEKFTAGEIKCLVNCAVFAEGTDIPRVETVIIAKPTKSNVTYVQMVGRGLRLFEGKKQMVLIDCIGVSEVQNLCTAPSLLGVDITDIPFEEQGKLEGNILDLPKKAENLFNGPAAWIKNTKTIAEWAEKNGLDTHGVNWVKMPNGIMICSLKDGFGYTVSAPDKLGNVVFRGKWTKIQKAFDIVRKELDAHHEDEAFIWKIEKRRSWDGNVASDKQKLIIKKNFPKFEVDNLSKGDASIVLDNFFSQKYPNKRDPEKDNPKVVAQPFEITETRHVVTEKEQATPVNAPGTSPVAPAVTSPSADDKKGKASGPKYKAVLFKSPYTPAEERYAIADAVTGDILDDAKGRGYKTPKAAHAAFSYRKKHFPRKQVNNLLKPLEMRGFLSVFYFSEKHL